jgi:hypothetical protein
MKLYMHTLFVCNEVFEITRLRYLVYVQRSQNWKTNTEPLCVEFCNLVQWHIHVFVMYVICYY